MRTYSSENGVQSPTASGDAGSTVSVSGSAGGWSSDWRCSSKPFLGAVVSRRWTRSMAASNSRSLSTVSRCRIGAKGLVGEAMPLVFRGLSNQRGGAIFSERAIRPPVGKYITAPVRQEGRSEIGRSGVALALSP
jgi:hypothetical protein